MKHTISSIHEAYAQKSLSVSELVDGYLKHIHEVEPHINSLITLTEREIRAAAKAQDEAFMADPDILHEKPLFGVPVVLKDAFVTRGIQTTAGAKVLGNYIPPYSATAWRRLEEAGALLIGKANCDAWAHGSSGENSQFGATCNPWNIEYVPGGSSSGSAASVAADFAPIAMGTDTGGSIRLPASFCNVVGLKPTYGKVSRYGVVAMASSLDSIGHFTHTIEDAARVLSITAGQDPYDATTLPTVVPDYVGELANKPEKLTIGLPEEYWGEGLDPHVRKVLEEVIHIFEQKMGVSFKKIQLPHTKYGVAVYYIVQTSEVSSNLGRYDGIRMGKKRELFGSEAKRRIMLGTYILSASHHDSHYKKAMQVRTLIRRDFDSAFEGVDAILAPVSPTKVFKLGSRVNDPLAMYLSDILTVTINLAGKPGISIPGGFDDDGMPVGFQLIGPQQSEQLLFQIGHAYQQQTDWHMKEPNFKFSKS